MADEPISTTAGVVGNNTVDNSAETVVATEVQPLAVEPAHQGDASEEAQLPPEYNKTVARLRQRTQAAERAVLEARAEADAAKAERERLAREIERSTASQDKPQRPRATDFFTPEEHEAALDKYDADMADWAVTQAERRVEAKVTQSSQQQAEARRVSEVQTAWNKQVAEVKREHADFDDVANEVAQACSEAMADAIIAQDNAARLTYYLGENPEELERIATLSPVRQISEIARLADKITAPAVSKAPPPIKPIGGSGRAVTKPVREMTPAEYFAHREAELKAEGKPLWS